MNKELAEKTSLLALKIGAELDGNLTLIKQSCTDEEFMHYRQATAEIMGELLTGFMNPIYKEYPSLKPKEMGGEYKVDSKVYR